MELLNKVMRYPERIPCDKRMHMLIGVFVAMILALIGVSVVYSMVVVIVIAWAIEVYQYLSKSGQYDNVDALAVLIGGAMVIVVRLV